jgi:hypothetical protein
MDLTRPAGTTSQQPKAGKPCKIRLAGFLFAIVSWQRYFFCITAAYLAMDASKISYIL